MKLCYILFIALSIVVCFTSTAEAMRSNRRRRRSRRPVPTPFVPFPGCRGRATYEVTLINFLTPVNFPGVVPDTGVTFSPPLGVSHSNRVSLFTVRGFASDEVEIQAEQGNAEPLARLARSLIPKGHVRDVVLSDGPTPPGGRTRLRVTVDCLNPFLTVSAMVAPSPDWIVFIDNENLVNPEDGSFVRRTSGDLIAYDAGTDSGSGFTDPSDLSLDIDTVPPKNIAPLVKDETDVFNGARIGRYIVRRIR